MSGWAILLRSCQNCGGTGRTRGNQCKPCGGTGIYSAGTVDYPTAYKVSR